MNSSAKLVLVALLALVAMVSSAAISAENFEGSKIDSNEPCLGTTPCGWAVYTPFTRRIDYFMKNQCSCPPEHKCLMASDDLSAKAYVYQCRVHKANPSTPETAS